MAYCIMFEYSHKPHVLNYLDNLSFGTSHAPFIGICSPTLHLADNVIVSAQHSLLS